MNTGEVVAGDPAPGPAARDGRRRQRRRAARAGGRRRRGPARRARPTGWSRRGRSVEPVEPLDLKGKAEPRPRVPARSRSRRRAGGTSATSTRRWSGATRSSSGSCSRRFERRGRRAHVAPVHAARPGGRREVPAGRRVPRRARERRARPARAVPVVRRGHHVLRRSPRSCAHAAGIGDGRRRDDRRDRGRGCSSATPTTATRIARLVGGLFGLVRAAPAPRTRPGRSASSSSTSPRTRPLVVVFDDIHWAEPPLLDLIEHLADWTRDAPMLLLCVARPELLERRPGWGGGKMNATTILLEPLAGDEAERAAREPARRRGPAERRARADPRGGRGQPAVRRGDARDADRRRAAPLRRAGCGARRTTSRDLTVPPTIQALLAARLDRLDAEERAVIERGAVEGKVFHAGAVHVARARAPARAGAAAPAHARSQGADPARPGASSPARTRSGSGTC